MLSNKSNSRVVLLMALALLVAQFGAQAHAYSHLHAGSDSSEQQDSHGKLCSECLSFAPLLATAGSPSHLFAVAPQGVAAAPDVAVASLITRALLPAFRSRAPPSNH